jgi:hypothetical protein
MIVREEERRAAGNGCNRRVGIRTPPRRQVTATCRRGRLGRGTNLATAVLELSQDGARLVIREALRVGEEVTLTWTCPPRLAPLRRVGAVMWFAPVPGGTFCVGIRFSKPLAFAEFVRLVRT